MIEISLRHPMQTASGPEWLELDLSIPDQAFCALSGSSGAGKTTLLRMLAGLAIPQSGRIVVNGEVWLDSARSVCRQPQQRAVGMVFQDYALFPNLTVAQNVAYALARDQQDSLQRLLALNDLTALSQRLPGSLSGGQKQRVALARALARVIGSPARLLLLDEPLSALDVSLRAQLQDSLASLHAELGLTTLLVSHDLGEIFKLAQTVFVLERGRIQRYGSPAEVFLQQKMQGQLQLRAQVLAIRQEEVIFIVSLLVGQDIIEIMASASEVAQLQTGAHITISTKAFSPLIFA